MIYTKSIYTSVLHDIIESLYLHNIYNRGLIGLKICVVQSETMFMIVFLLKVGHLESRLLSTEDVMNLKIREAVLGRNHRYSLETYPYNIEIERYRL